MIEHQPPQRSYTIHFYDGSVMRFTNIIDLVDRGQVFQYKIDKGFRPLCHRCGGLTHDQVNNRCIKDQQSYRDPITWEVKYRRVVYPNHDLDVNVVVYNDVGVPHYGCELRTLYNLAKPSYRKYNFRWHDRGDFTAENYPEYKFLFNRFNSIGWLPPSYRHMATMNERRQYFACQVDIDSPKIRGKRCANNLPNNWDDHCTTLWKDRSWKKTKKRKQWMVNLD